MRKMQTNMAVNKCYLADVILTFLSNGLPSQFPNKSNFPYSLSLRTSDLVVWMCIFIYPFNKLLLSAFSNCASLVRSDWVL